MKKSGWVSLGSLLVMALACGGSAPPPEEPKEPEKSWESTQAQGKPKPMGMEAEMSMGGESTDESEDEGSGVVHEPTAPEPEPEPEPTVAKPSRPPKEILTGAKIAFMINYPSSAPKKKAEEKCAKEFGENLAAVAKCKSEERKDFIADVLLFKKVTEDTYDWYVYRRNRETLFEVSKSRITFKDETENTITLQLAGKGSGARPLFISAKEVKVSVPSDSSIELDDPILGHLVYEAKIGLVGN